MREHTFFLRGAAEAEADRVDGGTLTLSLLCNYGLEALNLLPQTRIGICHTIRTNRSLDKDMSHVLSQLDFIFLVQDKVTVTL